MVGFKEHGESSKRRPPHPIPHSTCNASRAAGWSVGAAGHTATGLLAHQSSSPGAHLTCAAGCDHGRARRRSVPKPNVPQTPPRRGPAVTKPARGRTQHRRYPMPSFFRDLPYVSVHNSQASASWHPLAAPNVSRASLRSKLPIQRTLRYTTTITRGRVHARGNAGKRNGPRPPPSPSGRVLLGPDDLADYRMGGWMGG